MKILFISDNYPPEKNALANRSFFNSKFFSKFFSTKVLTCFPNYPYGMVHANYKKKFIKTENLGNLKIIRLPSYISKKDNGLLNFLDYLSFGIVAFIFSFFIKKDLIFTSSPPLPVAFFSILASKITFTKSILEVRDLWGDSIVDLGISKNRFFIFIIKVMENLSYKMANRIYCVTDGMKENLIKKNISPKKIFVMPNGFINSKKNSKSSPLDMHFNKYKNYLNLTFIGTIGFSQDFEILFEVAKYFKEKKVLFTIIGNGSKVDDLKKIIRKNFIKNIFVFKTGFDTDEKKLYKNVKFGFSFLKKNKTFKTVIPSKIYDYMGNNIFVLFYGPKGDASKLIKKNKLGLTSHSKFHLIKNIDLILNNQKIRLKRKIFNNDFSRTEIAKKMCKNIKDLIKK